MIYICSPQREFSSVGSEHLPYKQGVTGSNPVSPTGGRSSIWLEHRPVTPEVAGSNPVDPALNRKAVEEFQRLFVCVLLEIMYSVFYFT